MATHNFAFPVLPGKEADARAFADAASGSGRHHYDALMHKSGTTRVTWTLQETPAGSFVLVWFEADDPGAIFEILATDSGDDAVWMRGWVERVGGVDMTEPPPGPPPELILEWPG